MRLAFLSAADPWDRRSNSGILYHMLHVLQERVDEVICIGPLGTGARLFGKMLRLGARVLLRKDYSYNHSFWLARYYATQIDKSLARHPCDMIIAPFGTAVTAFLKTQIPVVLVEDATFAQLHNYYPCYSNLLQRSIDEAETLTLRAFVRASWLIFSSQWAADSAIRCYHIPPEKVQVIPFGANVDDIPNAEKVIALRQGERSPSCRLLLMGVDWQRKGADIALETLQHLQAMGIQSELVICGCVPPEPLEHDGLLIVPFLNKNRQQDRAELRRLYMRADFLLAPSRADCTPCVLGEANAFGLPVIAANTGGISTLVQEGENGHLLSARADGVEYARLIATIYHDEQRYARLAASSRSAFEQRLNWNIWGDSVEQLLASTSERKNSSYPYSAVILNSRRKTKHLEYVKYQIKEDALETL